MAKTLSLDQWLSGTPNALPPLMVVFTDEPLFVTQVCDRYRSLARQLHGGQRQVVELDRSFDEARFVAQFSEMSLFGEASLIDLRIPQLKFTKDTTDALRQVAQWIAQGQTEHQLLVSGPTLNKTQRMAAGLGDLLAAGTEVVCPDITAANMGKWLQASAKRLGLALQADAVQWLVEHTEGNLLAAHQALEKLNALQLQQASLAQVQQVATNAARYNVFELSPAALSGDKARVIRMVAGLQAEGEAPTLVLWALQEDVRALRQVKLAMHRGMPLSEACKQSRIWGPRQTAVATAERKHTLSSLATLAELCYKTEKTIKGLLPGNPWTLIEMTALGIAGIAPLQTLEHTS